MKKITALFVLTLILWSCKSDKETNTGEDGTTSDVKVSLNSDSYDCLKKLGDDYASLLSKDEMNAVYPIDFENATHELRTGNYGEHIYQWPSDRPDMTIEVSNMKMDLPDKNILGIKNFTFKSDQKDLKSAVATFDMGYKKLSEAELKKIKDNLSKQNDEIQKTGNELLKVREARSWDFVEQLGSSAWYKWSDNYGGELVVLAGKAQFTILTKVNDDPEKNREVAENLARKVLSKC